MAEALIVVLCAVVAVLAGVLLWMARKCLALQGEARLAAARQEDAQALEAARARVLDAQRETLRQEFGVLAARLLGEQQKNLVEANARSVDGLFRPLREKLEQYEHHVRLAAGENVKLGEHMKTQLSALQQFADRAQAFTAALVGGNKIQGNRGEEILANILAQSGFERGREYDVQTGPAAQGRPDVSIYDAMNKRIILVDAKMNIKDYIEACNLPDDTLNRPLRERALKAHAASVRKQIDGLSARQYAATLPPSREGYENLPLVAMFCPFNAVLESALAQDPTLMQYAYERSIVLVTPLTLWGYLWLVSWGWKRQAVEKSFDEIQRLGGEVVRALEALVGDLENVGKALGQAQGAYDALYKRVTEDKGRMSVRRVAENLSSYGIASSGKRKQP
jgi:DNA recombination protein RmuC